MFKIFGYLKKSIPQVLLIIVLLVIQAWGGPYFGGQRAIEAYKNYTGKATAADVLGTWTQKAAEHPTLLKADAQGTKEQQAAKKGGPFTDVDQSYLDLFQNAELRDKMMKMDATVDDIRRRFGFYSIQRGLMLGDTILSAVNAKEEHTVHPHGYF